MKIIISAFCVMYLVYILSFFFPEVYFSVVKSIDNDRIIGLVINVIKIGFQAFLIYRFWQFKSVIKDTKWKWTVLIIIIFPFAAPYFVCKVEPEWY